MKKQNRSFNPDDIAMLIRWALKRDFHSRTLMHLDESDPIAYAKQNQIQTLLKKYEFNDADPQQLENEAFAKFLHINERMRCTNEHLQQVLPFNKVPGRDDCSTDDLIHLRARNIVHWTLKDFSIARVFAACKITSGSSLGVSYKDTSPEAKFTFPISVSSGALPLAKAYLAYDNSFASAVHQYNLDNKNSCWYVIEDVARGTTVNKDSKTRRFIQIQPTFDSFLQQGLMTVLYEDMKAVGLDVRTLPEQHKKLACQSSISKKNATIDWSSASDCVSQAAFNWIFPVNHCSFINSTRATEISLADKVVPIHMIACMGNACTFPVETLIFWAYAHAVLYTHENPKTLSTIFDSSNIGRISVFGDDCVVPTAIAVPYMNFMEGIGFIVNKDKSFFDDVPFRESCGGDFLAGVDVRPFHLKRPDKVAKSTLEPWLCIIFNRLLKKYISYFSELTYVYDKVLFKLLSAIYRQYNLKLRIVPDDFPDDSGVKLSSDLLRFLSCYRFGVHKISRSLHGTYSFTMNSFRYWDESPEDDGLRYNLWLKKPIVSSPPWDVRLKKRISDSDAYSIYEFEFVFGKPKPELLVDLERDDFDRFKSIRTRGGYVVSKTLTSHWFVPYFGHLAV